jgi:hypothetical protein
MKPKLIFDIALLLLFGVMCNTSVTGTAFHEMAGMFYTALIAVHLIINRQWIFAAFSGNLLGKRSVVLTIISILLFLNLAVILLAGIRASHFLFPSAQKAPDYFLFIHAVCGVIAAVLVFTHVLVHAKVIAKKRVLAKIAFVAILSIVIGYSLVGTVQGTVKWAGNKEPKSDTEQYQNSNRNDTHKLKEDESKK